jgi:hypothetical protein
MSEGIQFDDQNEFKSREIFGVPKKPGMISWLQKNGIVKDDKTAHYILIGVIVVCFGVAGFLLAGGFETDNVVNDFSGYEDVDTLEGDPAFIGLPEEQKKEILKSY